MKFIQYVAPVAVSLVLSTVSICSPTSAQSLTPVASQAKDDHPKPMLYRTIYITRATQQNEANDVQTTLRNMLPRARICYVASQDALTLRANAEDRALAESMVADLDRPRKLYRLTCTMTKTDGNRQVPHRAMRS